MLLLTEGIPSIPDLTHPQELLQFGQQLLLLCLFPQLDLRQPSIGC